MLRLSKKMIFALEAVVDIAYHGGAEPVQSRDISRRQEIPQRYLEQVMQRLVRAGILKGVRGPKGGYRLARERRRILVSDVAKVVFELEAGTDVVEKGTTSELAEKVVRPLWRDLRESLMVELAGVTIEELCTRANKEGIRNESQEVADYSI
ncbi:MAG: Rrf2 family transcriptional regulator [Alphaproteobacteria bacterium]|jgi:Rrf2 family transcriptional regulator, iron-sulfur cluster assembly transcription factor|nr:Rrf2 family transcriptional regulator [Alphaproteobacteria bacterium]MBT4016754.1 Rrf2 family transcriptional regulator [Alphaproteobacteria bacterium]MBT5158748.1 Rrf2 family transcriptional regulator [Alphaproteobacteria bacterium]MBT5916986.1 Rrf2 family transcriptional regulator [Alphaproteobacteria bacterium]MBT6386837.1 Rrf2 family transcriptional regulator [Alphaproteobacteria bacterium]